MADTYWADRSLVPKRQNRFILEMNLGQTGQTVSYLVKTSGRPSFSVTEAEHRFLSHKFYFPGVVEWETLDVTLVDPVSPNASNIMWEALGAGSSEGMGWNEPNTFEDAKQAIVSKKKATEFGINGVVIRALDGDGNVADEWALQNCWVQAVKFGDFDYSGDDLIDVTLTLRFDWASYNPVQR